MSDFWNSLINSPFVRTASEHGIESSIDRHLNGGKSVEGSHFLSVRDLTDSIKNSKCIKLPVESGSRVSFSGTLGSILTYDNPPMPDTTGTVVTVRTAFGDSTTHDGRVFVKWDTGEFGSFDPVHIYPSTSKQANNVKVRVSSIGDLSSLFASSNKEGELVHKATQDIWSFKKTNGGFTIERLFDDSGEPLKV